MVIVVQFNCRIGLAWPS